MDVLVAAVVINLRSAQRAQCSGVICFRACLGRLATLQGLIVCMQDAQRRDKIC